MARPRKNPLPVNAAAENDAVAVETKAVQEAAPEVTTTTEEEAKPAKKRVGRPAGSKKVKAEEKKEEVKKERKRAGRRPAEKTVEKIVEKVEAKVVEGKKAGRPAKNAEVAVIIQFEGRNIETKNVAEIAKENWVASGKRESSIKTLEIYINVTEGMAYPVINGEAQNGFSCS